MKKLSVEELAVFRRMGALGGRTSARNLTAKQRSERARRGGLARAAQRKRGTR